MSEILWDRVSKTNPQYTKNVSVAGKPRFTNVDTYWLLQEATKEFGSYGAGFGIQEMNWSEKDFTDGTVLMILDAVFYYTDDNRDTRKFPIRNALKCAYNTKQGYLKIDEDAPKKITTNTIAKALSYLGFASDVYLGKYEDMAYIDEVAQELVLISAQQRQQLAQMIQESKTDLIKFNESFSITKLSDLPQREFNKAVALLQSKINKMTKDETNSKNS